MTDFIEDRLTNIESHLDRIATVLEQALSEHPVHADDDPGELEQPQGERVCLECGFVNDIVRISLAEDPRERFACGRCGHIWEAVT